jgi:hypothetical protein
MRFIAALICIFLAVEAARNDDGSPKRTPTPAPSDSDSEADLEAPPTIKPRATTAPKPTA